MELSRKQTLVRHVAWLTSASTAWLVTSPAIALASPVNRPPKPLGHTRTLGNQEMARIFGARQIAEAPSTSSVVRVVEADLASGSTEAWEATAGSGVSTASGNKLTQHPIVSWTQRGGLPIAFTLSHSSIGATNDTAGKKWTHSFNVYLKFGASGGGGTPGPTPSPTPSASPSPTPTPPPGGGPGDVGELPIGPGGGGFAATSSSLAAGDTVQAVFGDGRGVTFTENIDGSYSPTAGNFETMVKNGDGTYTLTKKDLTVWTFGATGWLRSIADRNGNTATLTYNTSNQVTAVTDATGRQLTLAWDGANGRITSATDPAGRTWNFAYDASGNLQSVTDPAATSGGTRHVTAYAYDGSNRITQITDRRGKAWTFGYDSSGRLSWEKTPLLHQTSYVYTPTGCTVTDPRGNSVVHTYNSLGELVSVKDEANHTESYGYNPLHLKTLVTDKRGKAWSYSYDNRGNVLTVTNPLSQQTSWTYNTKDLPLTETTPLGYATVYTYDSAGNQTSISNPLSQTTTYTIGTYGLVSAKTDARSKATSYSYDTNGNLTQVTTPGSKVTGFSYNVLGVPTGKTDAAGRVSTFTLDGLFRKVGATYAENGNATMTESFTYDASGNVTAFTDGTGTTSRSYDDDGRLTGETKGSNTVTYAYDGTTTATKGRLVSVTDAAGRIVSHTYTVRGQLASVSDGTGTASYTYGAGGEELTTTNANGTTVTKTYDDAGRLASLTNKNSGGTTLSAFAYTYRADGKKATATEADGSVVTYTYDDAGRLTGESRTGSAAFAASYTLDADGNRTSQTIGTATTAFTYDTDDALTSVSSTTGGLNNSYTYNANGDQITRTLAGTTYTLAYNSKGELAEITSASSPTKLFAYDAMERRVERTSGSTTTTFVRSGDKNGGIILNEKQGSTTTASYTYGNGLLAKGSDSYLFDGQGSTRQVTNASGAVASSSASDGFGNTVASSGAKPEYGYNAQSGYRDDGDAGLVHIAARYYDAQVGLFTTRDTYLTEKPYQYCEHDPINATDPSGHAAENVANASKWVKIGGGLIPLLVETILDEFCPDNSLGHRIARGISGVGLISSGAGFIGVGAALTGGVALPVVAVLGGLALVGIGVYKIGTAISNQY
jgi:RHS repeat-associated protein